jgi:hypothetical protein
MILKKPQEIIDYILTNFNIRFIIYAVPYRKFEYFLESIRVIMIADHCMQAVGKR